MDNKYLESFKKSLREYYVMLGLNNIDRRIEDRVSRERSKRIVDMFEKKLLLKQFKILDVGCGWGEMQLEFLNWKYTKELYGIEPDNELYEISYGINSNVKNAPAEDIPFEDDMFDLIIFNDVLEHVQNHQKALEEIVRVTSKNGYIYISFPNYRYPSEAHYKVKMLPLSCFFPKWIYKINLKILGRDPMFFEKYVNPICDFQFFKILKKISEEMNFSYEIIDLNINKFKYQNIFGKPDIKVIIKIDKNI